MAAILKRITRNGAFDLKTGGGIGMITVTNSDRTIRSAEEIP